MKLIATVMVLLISGICHAGDMKFEEIKKGSQYPSKEGNHLIKDKAAWKQLLEKTKLPLKEAAIDFDKHMVLAVFLGSRNSGGYHIRIEKVEETDDKIIVHVLRGSPSKDAMVTMAMTGPYHLVKIPKSDKPVEWQFASN